MPEMDVVGQHTVPLASEQFVTGSAAFVGDLHCDGMLVGKLLYAMKPSALIRRIDVTAARSLPGVAAVLTHADVPGENSYLYIAPDQPLLAGDRVCYQGDALAAVAAESEEAALAALGAIEVELEELPGVFDAFEAMQPAAQPIVPGRSNILHQTIIDAGDTETAFGEADVIIENTYHTQRVEQAFLEPEGAVALVQPDGTVVVYSSTQDPFLDRRQIARALAIPQERVRVIVPRVGGAFGGKLEATVQIHAALLAQATGRPVRIIVSREESILAHPKRHPMKIRYKTGARSDGSVLAVHVVAIADAGPYANTGPEVIGVLAAHATGPYVIPNAHVEAYLVATNNPNSGAMRGFGVPQVTVAVEAQMDALAKALAMDPLDIRLKNGLESGVELFTGIHIREASGMKATLRAAANLCGWQARRSLSVSSPAHLRRGWGIGAGWKSIGYGRGSPDRAGVVMEMDRDGCLTLRTAAIDMGQGTYTALAQLAAEAVGLSLTSVRVLAPNTETAPEAGATDSSRQTFVSGNAVLKAAATIRKTLLAVAAGRMHIPASVLSLRQNRLYAEGEALSVTAAEVAGWAAAAKIRLSAEGFYEMEHEQAFQNRGYAHPASTYSFGTHIAQVLVDLETGQVTVEKLYAVHDVGQVVNPLAVRGQIAGGCVMGVGYALMEDLVAARGRTLNMSLDGYLIPTALDTPALVIEALELAQPRGPYGVTGLGEIAMIPTAAAILNAVSDALNIGLRELPLTAERVHAALCGPMCAGAGKQPH